MELDGRFYIIPEYVLEQIARNGTTTQKDRAQRALTMSAQIRSQRALAGYHPPISRAAPGQKDRTVCDAQNGTNLPGVIVKREGDAPSSDAAVEEAYEGSGHTYDLYYSQYQRNSIDDQGMGLDSTVHYGQGYDNAFWNGQRMVYGDGDEDLPENQRIFNRFTKSLDVIGHELSHGVVQHTAGLVYMNQPGALNESFADVFGILTKQRVLNQTADQADWLIGSELITSNVNGVGLRSMKDPGTAYDDPLLGKDPQPGHMNDYKHVSYDNGGVHINSGIPNRAFYFAATEIGGYAWERVGRIWYITLKDRLDRMSSFQNAANQTLLVARQLYGEPSAEERAVINGWSRVGINPQRVGAGWS